MDRDTFHFFHCLFSTALAVTGAVIYGPPWMLLWGAFALFNLGSALVHVLWEEKGV